MTRWATFRRILTLSCEESTRLVSQSLDRDLPRGERVALRLHALICRSCRRFRRQVLALRELIRAGAADPTSGLAESGPGLSDEARARIRRALDTGAQG